MENPNDKELPLESFLENEQQIFTEEDLEQAVNTDVLITKEKFIKEAMQAHAAAIVRYKIELARTHIPKNSKYISMFCASIASIYIAALFTTSGNIWLITLGAPVLAVFSFYVVDYTVDTLRNWFYNKSMKQPGEKDDSGDSDSR